MDRKPFLETMHQQDGETFPLEQSRPLSSTSMLRLPPEVLDMVFSCSSPEALASIVCLNKEYHQVYGALLYRDIHIRTPYQLVKLYRSTNAAHNLSYTSNLSIARPVFLILYWKGIHRAFRPPMYLGRVLQMTTSLRRLSLDCLDYNSSEADDICCFFGRLFIDEIRRRAHDPLFLPRLSVLESPATPSLLRICRGRPVESISHIRDSDPATNPLLTHLHPLGASQSRLSVSIVVPTGLEQYRVNAMGAFSTLYTAAIEDWVIKHLKITVVGPRDQSSVPTEAGCPAYWAGIISDFSAHLESLRIEFDPPLAENSMKRQRLAIKAAARHIPSLAYAVVGSSDVEWGKRVEKQPNSTSRIPDWTPRPNRGGWKVLSWWLRRSGVDSSKATKADVPVLLMRIRNIMLTRWDDDSVPSVGDLRRRIKFDAITN